MSCERPQFCETEICLYDRNEKERVPFVSDECEFWPAGWAKIEGVYYPLGYKVVDENLRSLGLRKNPNIMTFPVGEWVRLPDESVVPGSADWGGVWTALRKGSIKTLKNYCLVQYGMKTRAFLTAMDRPVFANSYRIKSQGVMLLSEIL